ncbi:MAG: glycoside hydrolase family protein [Minicystis sp.]
MRWWAGAATAALFSMAACGSSDPSPGSGGGAGATGGGPPISHATGCKRGVAYGHHSKADMAALSPAVSWWYNWAHVPDEGVRPDAYKTLGVEYVPMVWGGGDLDDAHATQIASEIPGGAGFLLGFNEPNFGAQANLSASDAAALWPHVEAIADARGLALVSPAVNFCGGDCQETDPFKYLDDFFAACEGCRVDYIGIHIYTACQGDGTNKARWLINHIETYKMRFQKPIWLTEFACDNAGSLAEQKAFMIDALDYLENEPRIARYAWFSGRADNVANASLLGDDGALTELGQAYVGAPQKPCE